MKLFTGNIYRRAGIRKFELKYTSEAQLKLARMIDPKTERVIGEDWKELERIALAQVFGNNRYSDVTPRAQGIKAPDRKAVEIVKEEVRLFKPEDIAPIVRTAPKEVQEAFKNVAGGIVVRNVESGEYQVYFFTEKDEADREFESYKINHDTILRYFREKGEEGEKTSSIKVLKLTKEGTIRYAFKLIKKAILDSNFPATDEAIDETTLGIIQDLMKEENIEKIVKENLIEE